MASTNYSLRALALRSRVLQPAYPPANRRRLIRCRHARPRSRRRGRGREDLVGGSGASTQRGRCRRRQMRVTHRGRHGREIRGRLVTRPDQRDGSHPQRRTLPAASRSSFRQTARPRRPTRFAGVFACILSGRSRPLIEQPCCISSAGVSCRRSEPSDQLRGPRRLCRV